MCDLVEFKINVGQLSDGCQSLISGMISCTETSTEMLKTVVEILSKAVVSQKINYTRVVNTPILNDNRINGVIYTWDNFPYVHRIRPYTSL